MSEPGLLLDRYLVSREIRSGVAAIVYAANDTKLNRSVALKILREEVAGTIDQERFLREISLLAPLHHPNIVPLLDSGTSDGRPFFVMPLISGLSLRERLSREGPMPFEEAIRLIREVLEALEFAHGHGVIHRDLKPGNILLDDEHAVVADFGISRALGTAEDRDLTASGIALGTPAYMSPEQISADRDLDSRTDIYSVGCTLFEMLAGAPPFDTGDPRVLAVQHMAAAPPSLPSRRPDTPASIARILEVAMAKDPDDRYENAREFSAALDAVWEPRRLAGSSRADRARARSIGLAAVATALVAAVTLPWLMAGDGNPSPAPDVLESASTIAVVPFATSGEGVGDFGVGVVRLISANLDDMGVVRTVSPRSVLAAWPAGGSVSLERSLRIAQDLGARSILMGTIVSAGGSVRIAADLLELDGERVARAAVEGRPEALLTLVDSLSFRLLRAVWKAERAPPTLRAGAISSTSFDAVRHFLLGENAYAAADWNVAIEHYRRAVEDDPTFALAQYRLYESLSWVTPWASPQELGPFRQALAHLDRLPPAERALVSATRLDQEGRLAAVDSLRAFVARNPHDPEGWYLLGDVLHHSSSVTPVQREDVLGAFERAHELAPEQSRALVHPLQLTAMDGDSVAYRRLVARVPVASPERDRFARWGAMLWGDTRLGRSGLVDLLTTRPVNLNGAMLAALLRSSRLSTDSILSAFAEAAYRFGPRDPESAILARQWGRVAIALGRPRAAEPAFQRHWSEDPDAAAVQVLEAAAILGDGVPTLERAIRHVETRSSVDGRNRIWLAWQALGVGDSGRASDLIDEAREASAATDSVLQGLISATGGWERIVAGDTLGGLEQMSEGLARVGYGAPRDVLWYQWERAATRRTEHRQRAMALLEHRIAGIMYLAPRALALTGAATLSSAPAVAERELALARRVWRDADSALRARLPAPLPDSRGRGR